MKNLRRLRPLFTSLFSIFLTISWFAPEAYSKGHNIGFSSSTEVAFLAPPVCNIPTWPVTSNITMNAATFSWDAVYGAQSYSVQTRVPNGTWYNVPGSPFTNTYATVTWFLPNTTYEWRVRTNCTGGDYSYWSSPITFTTLGWDNCDAPSWLYTNNITQTSATFDWESVNGAISYDLQYRVWGGSWINVYGGPFTQTWYTISNLLPGTTYEWRVRSNCSNWTQSPWSYPEVFTTLPGYEYCDAPSWLYTTNITSTSATLDWEPVSGAISYNIQWKEQGGYWHDISSVSWNQTWYTLYNLNPNTTYQWRVQTNCSNWTHSSWSYIESFTTLGGYCSVPTWPTTSNITQTSAKFSWDAVYGANSYTVQIRQWGGSWSDLEGGPFYNTWVTANWLTPCTTYEWRVRTNCSNWQYSYWTNPTVFTTSCGNYCDTPSWLYSSNITHNSATLGWDAVPGAYSYSVQWKVAGGSWQDLTGGATYNNWVSLWGLQPGTSYEWRVRTNCSNWMYSSWSYTAWFTTLGYSCGTPSWLSTTNVTESSASFNWSSVWGAWSYTVQIRELNGGLWANVPESPFLNNSGWVSGLTPGKTYQWRVRTNCEDGQYSNWSYAVTFTTSNVTVCNAPQWLYSSNITETSANLSWTSVSGALSYNVEYRIAGGGSWLIASGSPFTSTWATISSLLAGTTYEWRVSTKCYFSMQSPWSYTASFTTQGNACAVPTGLVTSNITDTTATLLWNSAPGAGSYGVQTRTLNGVWNDVSGTPVSDTSVIIDGLIPGVTYEWRVRSKCGAGVFSYWSNPASFTTTGSAVGGIDECDGATVLTVNNSCVNSASSNVGATESAPPPMGWCPENNHKDVWFKFTMPDVANPEVTIRTTAGTLFDGVMEIYSGADCSSLVYLYCEDDNTSYNGSLMPVISITGSPNETIWVRVWGYAGTTGSFSICVFDYQSNNYAGQDESADAIADQPLSAFEVELEKTFVEYSSLTPSLHISPNPTRDVLQVSYNQSATSTVSRILLMDMSGKVVFKKEYSTTDIHEFKDQLDVSAMAPGMYVLRVTTTTGILSEKISVID